MTETTTPSVEGKTIASYLETEGLAKARELIAKGGEEQLNRAVYILEHVPKQVSASTLVLAEAKLEQLASLKEKQRKTVEKRHTRRIAAIVALVAAIICAPFALGAIKDQIALSGRLKPDASENPVVISYDGRYYGNLCEEYIDKALDGEELSVGELRALLQDNCKDAKTKTRADYIFKTIFPSAYDEAIEKWGNADRGVTTDYDNTGIKKLTVENNKYSLQVTGELSVVDRGYSWALNRVGQITYTLDLYFGVPSKNKVTVANAKVTSLTWEESII